MAAAREARPDDCMLCDVVGGVSGAPVAFVDAWSVTTLPRLSGPGALAVVARRHAEGLADLVPEELASLGPLLGRVSRAMQESCAAPKVYLFSFGENHRHFHVGIIARPDTLEPHRRGPALVLSHLGHGPPPPDLGRPADEILADVAGRLA